jgi:hypothetical protein
VTRLIDSALADAFREGREDERGFAAWAAEHEWPSERWQARYTHLIREVEQADTAAVTNGPRRRNYLFGRLSIVENILEGESIT